MAIDQHLQEAVTQHEVGGNGSPLQKWKPDSDAATALDDATACFDCNICLECAQDPVVTLCGHLYCWPCIYKWLNLEGSSAGSEQLQQCPVCKADVSHTTIVPLYGRGQAPMPTESESKSPQAFEIPRRPPACGVNALITTSTASRPGQQLHRNPYQSDPQASHQQYYPHQYRNFVTESSPMFNLRGTMTTNFFHPMAGMLWEMVYQRMFGNSQSERSFYASPNSYYLSSPRVTRQVMQADKSLNRISIFLLCCLVLCLLLF